MSSPFNISHHHLLISSLLHIVCFTMLHFNLFAAHSLPLCHVGIPPLQQCPPEPLPRAPWPGDMLSFTHPLLNDMEGAVKNMDEISNTNDSVSYDQRFSPVVCPPFKQAVSPFIDAVTKQKIVFIDKGLKEAQEMNERFQMDKMEESIGGGRQGLIYSKDDYEKIARQFDAETAAALEAMEAVMKAEAEAALVVHKEGGKGGADVAEVVVTAK